MLAFDDSGFNIWALHTNGQVIPINSTPCTFGPTFTRHEGKQEYECVIVLLVCAAAGGHMATCYGLCKPGEAARAYWMASVCKETVGSSSCSHHDGK
jgi:hypothetical protein